ncbi:MAG: Cro/Cl family transcriptional regulator [Microbacterium sp.]|nr:MAG: Cro/Cl family transcriptional regulator [Microbacterium sp.]
MADVLSVSEARSNLTRLIKELQKEGGEDVIIGSHRTPQAILAPYSSRQGARVVSLRRLRELRGPIERLAWASHLADVRVYGSVARGQEAEGSDVDILVTPTDRATLFDVAQFELDLEAVLGVPVSVASTGALDPARDAGILAEAIAL